MAVTACSRVPRADDVSDADHRLTDPADSNHLTTDWRARARAAIAAIDQLLEILEEGHLHGPDMESALPPRWRGDLEAAGLAVPAAVFSASSVSLLHERLVDWQQELLGVAYPRRTPAAEDAETAEVSCEVIGEVVSWPVDEQPTHEAREEPSAGSATEATTRGPRRRRYLSRRSARRLARPALEEPVPEPGSAVAAPHPGQPSSGRHLNGLTDREIAVLRIVAEGLTNAQVATRLNVSEHTVAAHLRSIYRKTEVASRSAATRYAFEHGLA